MSSPTLGGIHVRLRSIPVRVLSVPFPHVWVSNFYILLSYVCFGEYVYLLLYFLHEFDIILIYLVIASFLTFVYCAFVFVYNA